MQVPQAVQTGLNTFVDYSIIKLVPGIGKPKQDNTVALINLADSLAKLQACGGELKDLNFTSCYQASQEHLWHWNLASTTKKTAQIVFMSTLPVFGIRAQTAWTHNGRKRLRRMGNKVNNVCADVLCSRTSVPFYVGQKEAYMPKEADSIKVTRGLNRAYDGYRQAGDDSNKGKICAEYNDVHTTSNLIASSGLIDSNHAGNLLRTMFPKWTPGAHMGFLMVPQFRLPVDFGLTLHTMPEPQAIFSIIALAAYGCMFGWTSWKRLNLALIRGAWPWLNRYSKNFAKATFLTMISIFSSLECGYANPNVRTELLTLANCLVGRASYNQGGPLRMRVDNRIREKKIRIAAAPNPDDKSENPMTLPQWTTQSTTPSSSPLLDCRWIVQGQKCNHGTTQVYTGRLKVASSLTELEDVTRGNSGISIALTLEDEEALAEATKFVVDNRILSVIRGKDQCIYCACKVAHTVSALVVIA